MHKRTLSIPSYARVPGNPVITPDPASVFDCPMRGRPIQWEALHTFNPAAVVRDGKVHLLYRAEDNTGAMKIGAHTSRLGIAVSDDGINFRREKEPVVFPDSTQKEYEWDGGCEDQRLVEMEDGTYVLTYTQWNRKLPRLAIATSRDLRAWTKHGPAFSGADRDRHSKSGAIVCALKNDRLIAAKVNGKYVMYWGEQNISCAVSDDGIHWDAGDVVLPKREDMFDASITEGGPSAVLTDDGIVVIYNGSARGNYPLSDIRNRYAAGCAIFDADDTKRCLARTDEPFFKPEASYELSGQYVAGDIFFEGMVYFKGKWFIYYGAADSCVAVAVADALPSLAG